MKYLILFVLVGCSTYHEPQIIVEDHRLRPFVDAFIYEAEKRNVSLHDDSKVVVKFATLRTADRKIDGLCVIEGQSNMRVIKIDWTWYNKNLTNLHNIEWTVFHECGHCLLNLDHIDTLSYMMPISFKWQKDWYYENREMLLNDLFK